MNFYKLAKPDGWDFYTGNTINYRNNIGKTVACPNYNRKGELCSQAFIHASREPNQCFIGAKIPCSAYLVSGKPIKEDSNKCGFKRLKVVEELKPEELFKWRYLEVINPINPIKIHAPEITDKHIYFLNKWYSVGYSVRDSVGDSVGDSVWAYIGYIFQPAVPKWQKEYPYQCCVDLFKEGFIPVFIDDKKYLWSKDRGLERIKGGLK